MFKAPPFSDMSYKVAASSATLRHPLSANYAFLFIVFFVLLLLLAAYLIFKE